MEDNSLKPDNEDEESQQDIKTLQKIEKEKKELLDNIISGNISTLKERVGYLLNRFIDTRNSDIELAWKYWSLFEQNEFDGHSITKTQMHELTKINSLTRCRAKIQNEYQLFQADDKVKKHRGVLQEEKRKEAIEDKPKDLPSYTVFIDETGKNHSFLCVGSLWIVEGGVHLYRIKQEIDAWKNSRSINYEFHFTEVTRSKLQIYKDFFIKFLTLNSTAGFKIIAVRNSGFQSLSQPITDLTFHLLNNGIQHEHSSRRAELPRILQVWLDEDEEGSDILRIHNLKERVTAQNIEGLYLDDFHAISSKDNYFIQAVDLFTASINRKINIKVHSPNHKDELADFILNITNFSINEIDTENTNVDSAILFNLTNFKANIDS